MTENPIYYIDPIRGDSDSVGTDPQAPVPSLTQVFRDCARTGIYDVRVMYKGCDGHWVEL